MADALGLMGMGGAAGFGDSLQTLFAQRMQQAQLQLQQKKLEQEDALTRIKLQEVADAKRAAEQARQDALKETHFQHMQTQLTATPQSHIFSRPEMETYTEADPSFASRFKPAPMQPITPIGLQPPSSIALPEGYGPSDTMRPMEGTMANSPLEQFQREPTQAELDAEAARKERLEQAAATAQAAGERSKYTADMAYLAALARANSTSEKPIKVEHKDPETGRTVISYMSPSEVLGRTFEKGTSAPTQNRLAIAEAVFQTGGDIIENLQNPAYADVVGPAMGRYNTLRDWLGNPPPELSFLKSQIDSFTMANMGVHGFRSAEGQERLKQLYTQKHTPESLIQAIEGLNQFAKRFMDNEGWKVGGGRKPGQKGTAKSVDELMQLYGGGAAGAAGAKQ